MLFFPHLPQRQQRFNRTFMELKWNSCNWHVRVRQVLIVPLWNWNSNRTRWQVILFCFNRTFMELKSQRGVIPLARLLVLIVPLWNWNRTALFTLNIDAVVLIVPLWNWNRHCTIWGCGRHYVLIVPLWNWNQIFVLKTFEVKSF